MFLDIDRAFYVAVMIIVIGTHRTDWPSLGPLLTTNTDYFIWQ